MLRSEGVGLLAGFHAAGAMSFVGCAGDTCTYALTGTYHVDPQPDQPRRAEGAHRSER